MKIFATIPFFIVLLLTSCGNKQLTSTEQKPMPDWVNARPIDPAYYIGIGSMSKRIEPLNYAESAKKNALSNLASEIRVNVRSESFLNTMQVNTQVQEAYNQTIATTADEMIEGFEIVDTYETPTEYFVFYRLSRAKHESIRREKKVSIMQSAFDQLSQARDARDRADVVLSADLYLHGLFDMKDYWSDANPWNDNGQEIYLDNTLFRELRQMVSDIELSAGLERIVLNAQNRFREELVVRAAYKGMPVRGLKLQYMYDNGMLRNNQIGETDMNGEFRIVIERANLNNRSNSLNVRVDVDQFKPSDLDRRLINPMTESLRTSPHIIPITAEMPVVVLTASEKNLGQNLGTERLSTPIRTALDDKGFRFAQNGSQADYRIEITADTREGGTSQGFHVAYLEMQIIARDANGNILFQRSESNLKGLQLNFEAAGLDAYRNAIRRIEREISEALTNSLL